MPLLDPYVASRRNLDSMFEDYLSSMGKLAVILVGKLLASL